MIDPTSTPRSHPSDSFLAAAREWVEQSLDGPCLEGDRHAFFEAFFHLQTNDVEAAIEGFGRAGRTAGPPFDSLAKVALAECQRISGQQAAAIRQWKRCACSEQAPQAVRYVSWLSLARLAEQRRDQTLLAEANAALEKMGAP